MFLNVQFFLGKMGISVNSPKVFPGILGFSSCTVSLNVQFFLGKVGISVNSPKVFPGILGLSSYNVILNVQFSPGKIGISVNYPKFFPGFGGVVDQISSWQCIFPRKNRHFCQHLFFHCFWPVLLHCVVATLFFP